VASAQKFQSIYDVDVEKGISYPQGERESKREVGVRVVEGASKEKGEEKSLSSIDYTVQRLAIKEQ